MIGLWLSVILFNFLAYKLNKIMSIKQIAHLYCFTTVFQLEFDIFIDLKYHAYWYFTRGVDYSAIPANTILLPPVNMIFLNLFPFGSSLKRKLLYIFFWEIILLSYELLTLLPEPFGYFHYGWWEIYYSAAINPILLLILLFYYKTFIK